MVQLAKEHVVTIATPAEVLAFLWRKTVVLTLLRGRKDIRININIKYKEYITVNL